VDYLALIVGVLIGAAVAWLLSKLKQQQSSNPFEAEANQLRAELAALQQSLQLRLDEINRLRDESAKLRDETSLLNKQSSHWQASYQALQERLDSQKQELEAVRERFNLEFREIAEKLLEEKSKKFTDSNRENIDQILKPLKEKISEFEQKVETTHKEGLLNNEALKQQLLSLKELNSQMSRDAINLTRALKGENKTQGNWGEFILESVLEKSGLMKDREYFVQVSLTDEDGNRLQPDVVVKLPEDKSIVIDSKVSLNAYERLSSAETDAEIEAARKEHLLSVRNHLKGLSGKNYQKLHGVQSLDFVLLFIPIEPAFAAAVQLDPAIFQEAFDKNIVIVSPTTLLATLRTIASIWRQEHQNRNALEIAKKGGDMYDKFAAFAEDLIKLGAQMDTSKKTYDEAMKKLSTGTGNLVKRAADLKKLGVNSGKNINPLLNAATEEE
jgi:DNA recombination protein RmuC